MPFAIVFTKADKLSRAAAEKNVAAYKRVLLKSWEELPPIFVTSSEKGEGRQEILDYIYGINRDLEKECLEEETPGENASAEKDGDEPEEEIKNETL